MHAKPRNGIHVAIDLPAPDESFSSVLDRAASFWRVERGAFLNALRDGDTTDAQRVDDDNPADIVVARLAEAVGMPPDALRRCGIVDAPEQTAPEHRMSYCPLCWDQDAAEKRPPYFRRAWSRLASVACEVHHAPLLGWLIDARGVRMPPPALGGGPRRSDETWLSDLTRVRRWQATVDHGVTLNATADFARAAMEVIANTSNYPPNWRGSGKDVLDLLVLLGTNPAPYADHRVVDRLVPDVGSDVAFAGSRWASPPRETDAGWDALRRLGSPCIRRTLFWIAGAAVVPRWKPLPIRGWAGACNDNLAWWHRRIRPALSAHGHARAETLATRLDLIEPGHTQDLFAA
jgi:hypothetical protein